MRWAGTPSSARLPSSSRVRCPIPVFPAIQARKSSHCWEQIGQDTGICRLPPASCPLPLRLWSGSRALGRGSCTKDQVGWGGGSQRGAQKLRVGATLHPHHLNLPLYRTPGFLRHVAMSASDPLPSLAELLLPPCHCSLPPSVPPVTCSHPSSQGNPVKLKVRLQPSSAPVSLRVRARVIIPAFEDWLCLMSHHHTPLLPPVGFLLAFVPTSGPLHFLFSSHPSSLPSSSLYSGLLALPPKSSAPSSLGAFAHMFPLPETSSFPQGQSDSYSTFR